MSALASPTAPTLQIPNDEIVLTGDQDRAAKRVVNFMIDPEQTNLVIRGYAGTGKSTLLKHVLDSLPQINELAKITGSDNTQRNIVLSATTNKAAGALRQTTGQGANTVHSEMGLIVSRNPDTHKPELMDTDRSKPIRNSLLIVDEAYMADHRLLQYINQYTQNTKILWVGDPAQLLPVGLSYMPLIAKGFEEVALSEVRRQAADSPIIQLATLCRYAVETGKFFKFRPDGDIIQHVNRDKFGRKMLDSFDEHYGTPGAVKVLAWTNKTALGWNAHVKQTMKGSIHISVGDYVVVNKAIRTRGCALSTDQTVQITGRSEKRSDENIDGFMYEIDGKHRAFMPANMDDKIKHLKALRKDGTDMSLARYAEIEDSWIDLRDEYACTINKSQGSTYGTTYIDLDDISKCRNPNALARLLYVATSRPSDRIVFTGDIR